MIYIDIDIFHDHHGNPVHRNDFLRTITRNQLKDPNFGPDAIDTMKQLRANIESKRIVLTNEQLQKRNQFVKRVEKNIYDRLFDQALRLAQKALSPNDETDVFIEGRTNIIHEPEFGKISIMTDLFRTFEEKATLVKLLDRCMNPKGVRIAIGSESEIQEMETCSLVTSTYSYKGEVLGALGVIGPRRMNYSKVIPIVDYTAKLLTEILDAS